ncbi:hypothetical protein AKJ16_DCAP10117 [Drosera capensis]
MIQLDQNRRWSFDHPCSRDSFDDRDRSNCSSMHEISRILQLGLSEIIIKFLRRQLIREKTQCFNYMGLLILRENRLIRLRQCDHSIVVSSPNIVVVVVVVSTSASRPCTSGHPIEYRLTSSWSFLNPSVPISCKAF